MAIAMMPIIGVNCVNFGKKNVAMDKKSEPVAVRPQQPAANSGEALRSYFAASQALSFGFHCSTGGFVTKKIEDVPCCCCGGRMILQGSLPYVADSFAGLTGKNLANKINKDKDYFRSNQSAVAGMIAAEAEKNPELDAAGAVRAIGKNFNAKLREYCAGILDSTDEIAKENLGKENPVSQLIREEKKHIAKGEINRVAFTEKLVHLSEEGKIDPMTYDMVLNSAMQLPQNAGMASKHFGKIQGRANYGIFHELLKESTQTIEHVHPHSLGGPDDTDNYLAECGECNHPRGNMSYLKWIKIHPEYPVNAQKHIEWFQQQIVDGKINSKYDDYGTKIKATLSKESGGKMVLKVLDRDKIRELREKALKGEDVNVHEEIKKQEEEKTEKKVA